MGLSREESGVEQRHVSVFGEELVSRNSVPRLPLAQTLGLYWAENS